MWRVPDEKLKVKLPPGFYLMEDEGYVYLFHGEKQIASFLHTVTDTAILKAVAEAYRGESNSLKNKDEGGLK